LTGWNAVKSRVEQLQLSMTDEQIKDATAKIKELADVRTQSMEDVDSILRIYHRAVEAGDLKVGQSKKLDELLEKHMPSRDASPNGTGANTPNKRQRVAETA
jgi:homocitrate synthase